MSEQKHTTEPDVPDAEHYKCQLCNGTGSLDSDMNPFDAAMWNRTAACVNAMKGIADPAEAMAKVREAAATIATQAAEIARLTAERDADVVRMERATDEIIRLRAERDHAREDAKRMREALTPSGETKAAYMGEFRFRLPIDEDTTIAPNVPWTTIKEIMAAILKRAAVAPTPQENAG